jgi:hypothetical protein
MKFSQRNGLIQASEIIQSDSMSDELRNSLWSVLNLMVWTLGNGEFSVNKTDFSTQGGFLKYIWFAYFKKPIDTIPRIYTGDVNGKMAIQEIRNYFFSCKWFEVYDFLEFILEVLQIKTLDTMINSVLERELSAYRFISGIFTDITNKQQIEMLDEALRNNDYPTVTSHLRRALELLSNRENPDYRNSIKEAISAVESIARIITLDPKATLGSALKKIDEKIEIHPALKDAFQKLYGYTSDEDGIRHSMLENPNLELADAMFFITTCTAFINYLKAKMILMQRN